MKKMTTLVLACLFAISCLTGCSSRKEDASSISAAANEANGVNGADAVNGANAGNSADVDDFTAVTTTTTTAVPNRNVSDVDSNSKEKETTTTTTTTTPTTTTTKATTKVEGIGIKKSRKRPAFDIGTMLVLEVNNIQMLPELPAGSAVTSVAIALNYFGIKVDKMDLLNYLPMASSGDPNEVFVGSPKVKGSYCYAGALKKCIENYFKANNINNLQLLDNVTGIDSFKEEVYNGNLVIMWGTEDMELSNPLNVVVMMGYNLDDDTIVVSEPNNIHLTIEYPREQVENAYKKMGSMALVIREKS